MSKSTSINWKLFSILLAASILSVIAVLPYAFTLQGDVLKNIPLSLPLVVLLSIIQSGIVFVICIFVGLSLSKKVGFESPVVDDWEMTKIRVRSVFGISTTLGVLSGTVIIALDFIFSKLGSSLSLDQIQIPMWKSFLASFYGGIGEEIILRFFLMTFIVWVFFKIKKTKDNKPTDTGIWLALLISSFLFGLAHLPVTSAIVAITPLILLRAVLLNGIGGVVFGWLYWKKGLESAMIAHFSADIILHVVFPLCPLTG